ncbi:FliA/WhiG family RNA polymerase sigma factor [Desulfonatronovibrio hydrogenovorans]|uniref:FliA/WhiG family RNA polymerase sigma factor n=1 Tax=Desulfonatronovibrio hydrogenovorans TaxID=53245 RepID=UPI00048D2B4D|nr:FliA/WhiG family RNA polymerase sigma factor [Desulfonatronovibrio hydrogenovorans]
MAISNSSGKSCSSRNNPWQVLENRDVSFGELSPGEKDEIVRAYAHKIKISAARLKHRLPRHVEINELISAGTLGLMEALGNFDSSFGIKFETFADNRIKGAMLDELRKMDWFSRGLRKKVKRLEECIRDFEQNSGTRPTNQELKKITGFSLGEVEEGLVALQNQICLSLEAVQENFTLAGEQDITSEPQLSTVFNDLVDKVARIIDRLTEKERLVLSLYYEEELTMKEVARVLEVTEGRVSQLHSQAIGKIQKKFSEEHEEI